MFKDTPKENLVYLTADSPNIIESFDKSKIYIIGGIVDRNRFKNLCFERALTDGISHGKFPIKESINLGDYSTVLTVNHVVDLILTMQETNNWKESLEKVLPKRKKAKGEKEDTLK